MATAVSWRSRPPLRWRCSSIALSASTTCIAEFRIRLERKIGQHLTQTVKRGRPTKRSGRLTFSEDQEAPQLPQGVNKEMARQYRKLAAVPEESLDAYLVRARESESVPSSKGLIKFAGTSGKRASVAKRSRRPSDRAPEPAAPAPESEAGGEVEPVP